MRLAHVLLLVQLLVLVAGEQVEIHGQPKSGTTWLEFIIKTLTIETCLEHTSFCNTSATRRSYEMQLEGDDVETVLGNMNKHSLPGGEGRFKGQLYDATTDCRSTGLNTCLQRGLSVWSSECVDLSVAFSKPPSENRYIIIIRDPRAVIVSAYHYFTEASKSKKPFIDYCLKRIVPTAALTSLRYWWHDDILRKENPSLVLFYEDLLEDPINQYFRIASFLRISPSMPTLLRVLNLTSASTMRTLERKMSLPGPNRPSSEHAKVRSASAQAFRAEMNEADSMLLGNVTRLMYPILHPALQARYIFTYADDIALAGVKNSILLDYFSSEQS